MSTQVTQEPLPPEIALPLARLRFYVRAYVCARGLALVLAALAIAFWVTLAIDWLLEPSSAVRVAIMVGTALGIGWVIVRHWGLHLLVPLTDRNMALLLERSDQRLGDRLLTVVELSGREGAGAGFDPRMLSHTGNETRALMCDVRPAGVFNYLPLFWSVALAVLATLSIFLLSAVRPATVNTWIQRSVLLGPQRWERDTRITVEGFPADDRGRRSVKVAIGGDLEIRARADTLHRIPSLLELSYVTPEGTSLKQSMTMQGTAVPGRDPFQEYYYNFKNVQNSIRFDVRARRQQLFGKDDAIEDLWIDAVESPDLSDLMLVCKYPSYLKRNDETLSVTGIMSIPEGTAVTIQARATKKLLSAVCQVSSKDTQTRKIDVPDQSREFQLDLGTIRRDTTVLFTLNDTDGVSNRQPARLQLRAIADQAPQLDVRFASIGKAITPQALLPLRGSVADDHRLSKSWFEFQTSQEKTPRQQVFTMPKDGQLTQAAGIGLDVSSLSLKPGTRFYVWVKAEDDFPLEAAPHIGSTPRFELEVVTEQQLRGILEGTELVLRRRFEGIIANLRRTRDSLRRIETEGSDTAAPASSATLDGPAATQPATEVRTQNRSAIRVEDALQRCQWSSHETLEVADQFERILQELENNRVEHLNDLRSRLGDRIVKPLRATASKEFPKLKTLLLALRTRLAQNDRRPRAAAEAEKQLDTILRQMDQILAEMLESEGFNELLAQLRNMIQGHDNVSRMTRQRQQQLKKQLREGLE